MPNGRPGDSRLHDILHLGIPVFGPSCDALVREIAMHLPPGRLGELRELVEGWPSAADGSPQDLDALFHRLAALRDAPAPPLGPVPHSGLPTAPILRGGAGPGIALMLLGGAAGLPIGFVAYLVSREALLPEELHGSEPAMWAIVLAAAAPMALLGLVQGARPSRAGHALLLGMLGFLAGGIAIGLAGGVLAFILGAVIGVSQAEGTFAMGVVLGLMPVLTLAGGLACGIWAARRAWASWRR